MAIDNRSLYEQIDALASGEAAPSLATVEHILTDGYAKALSLEAERTRLQRRIGELAVALHEDGSEPKTRELADLSRRLSTADDDLSRLRRLLSKLRRRQRELRAAAA